MKGEGWRMRVDEIYLIIAGEIVKCKLDIGN